MIEVGSQVYVRWYGSVLQGVVVPNSTPDDRLLGSMVAVRIHLQGSQAVALFTPGHVYSSAEQCQAVSPLGASLPQQKAEQPALCPTVLPSGNIIHPEPHFNVGATVSAAISRLKWEQFKQAHWNHERNHMQVAYLEEGYRLYRAMIAEEIQSCSVPSGFAAGKSEQNPAPLEQKPQQIEQKHSQFTQLSFNF